MTYKLRFHELALEEWKKLDPGLRDQFKKKLEERLTHPRVPASALSGMPECFKIKLRSAGYRLVYRVDGKTVFVTVISVGRRDRNLVYRNAIARYADTESHYISSQLTGKKD